MKIRTRLERVVNANHGMVVTPDLYYMRNLGRKKGVRSISMMSAMFGTALDVKPVVHSYRGETIPLTKVRGFEQAAQKVCDTLALNVREGGLMEPAVTLSYGERLDEMRAARLRGTGSRLPPAAWRRTGRGDDGPDRDHQHRQACIDVLLLQGRAVQLA